MARDEEPITLCLDPLLVDDERAASICGLGRSYWCVLERSGLVGPRPVRLGRRRLWSVAELRAWVESGLPNRETWVMQTKRDGKNAEEVPISREDRGLTADSKSVVDAKGDHR